MAPPSTQLLKPKTGALFASFPTPNPSESLSCSIPSATTLALRTTARPCREVSGLCLPLQPYLKLLSSFAPVILVSFLFLKLPFFYASGPLHSLFCLPGRFFPWFFAGVLSESDVECSAEVKGTWGLGIISQVKVWRCDFLRSFITSTHPYERRNGGKAGSMLCFNQSPGPGKRHSTTKIILRLWEVEGG